MFKWIKKELQGLKEYREQEKAIQKQTFRVELLLVNGTTVYRDVVSKKPEEARFYVECKLKFDRWLSVYSNGQRTNVRDIHVTMVTVNDRPILEVV